MFSLLRTVHLHGPLKGAEGGSIVVYGRNAAELIEGATRQLQQFQPTAKGRIKIAVVGFHTAESLYQDLGDRTEVHIVPQFGGGKNALTQILVGVALVAVGMFVPGLAGTMLGSMIVKAGMLVALGGIAQMLAPQPPKGDESENNKYLGAPRNTVKIGTRIPILYGELRVGGHILAFDVNAVEFREST